MFFALRVFAADSFYDQLITLYSNASKIKNLDKDQGIWTGKCYPRVPSGDQRSDVQDVEAFITHWKWSPPPGSPLQPVDAFKFQIRPLSSDPGFDWTDFLAEAGNLGSFEEYTEEHVSPNTWEFAFPQPELQTAQEADVKEDSKYMYVWLRAVSDAHWACYLSFQGLP
jgi:hypothetical protein